jgi:hypothetical protein
MRVLLFPLKGSKQKIFSALSEHIFSLPLFKKPFTHTFLRFVPYSLQLTDFSIKPVNLFVYC